MITFCFTLHLALSLSFKKGSKPRFFSDIILFLFFIFFCSFFQRVATSKLVLLCSVLFCPALQSTMLTVSLCPASCSSLVCQKHASGLCKSYEDKHSALQDKLRETSLRLGRLDSVSWRVDYTLSSSELSEVNEPLVHLKLQKRGAESGCSDIAAFSVSADKFRVLLAGKFLYLSHVFRT
uniref:COMM domain containing 4 n=1 Tax=Oryzias melastigma TaxID=30732 RepID=A0A3B3DYC8_ORYME